MIARLLSQTAQHEQPSTPKKPLRSLIGSFEVQAPAWSWPWTLQSLAQPQVEMAVRRSERAPAPSGSPRAAYPPKVRTGDQSGMAGGMSFSSSALKSPAP